MSISPKPSGINTTPAGKAIVLERTKRYMENATMIIVIPFQGVNKENTDLLKNALPEGVIASIVKNALLRKCVEGTQFAAITEDLKQENMFLFCPEGTNSAAYQEFKKWQKEVKRTEPEHDAKVVVLENQRFVGRELVEMVSLPSKKELIARFCRALMQPATQLARVLQAVAEKYSTTFGEPMPDLSAQLEEILADIRSPDEDDDDEDYYEDEDEQESSADGEPASESTSVSVEGVPEGGVGGGGGIQGTLAALAALQPVDDSIEPDYDPFEME